MAHYVICSICGERFDRDKIECEKTSARRYAHVECIKRKENEKTKEEIDKEELEQYIMQLFDITYITPRIQKQLKTFIEEYKYTYSGIKKALIYFFEIKNNSIEKANGGIGIVPYVYNQSYEYYYSLWLAQQKNENIDIQKYTNNTVEVYISSPKRKPKKRKLFSFLDKE